MKGEMWDLFSVEKNAKGIEELNIWAKSICDVKKNIKRGIDRIMWTDAWIGRWDLLANELYDNVYWWWVIPVVNDVMNVFVEPPSGSIIDVPHRFDVWEFLRFGGK